jgi:transglutaminase-like putative cysteine protease
MTGIGFGVSATKLYGPIYNFILGIGFQNSSIVITSPSINNTSVDKMCDDRRENDTKPNFLLSKRAERRKSLLSRRVITETSRKTFGFVLVQVSIRFWAGDNEKQFDGSIRFTVPNISQEDYRYLSPSGYVDSDCPEILKIANSLVTDKMTDFEKLKMIHDFVASNIKYDYIACMNGDNQLNTATSVLHSQQGVCRDYAFTFAALARAAGIPTRVVYGEAIHDPAMGVAKHAWNEAYVDGKWINIDTS